MTLLEMFNQSKMVGRRAEMMGQQNSGEQYFKRLFAPKVHAVGQGGSRTPQTSEEIAQMLYGVGDGGHPQREMPMFQPVAPVPQYFGNDWSGMRRNIGMGGLGGQMGSVMGGGYGQPQRSPFGGQGGNFGSLLQMLGGGRY